MVAAKAGNMLLGIGIVRFIERFLTRVLAFGGHVLDHCVHFCPQ